MQQLILLEAACLAIVITYLVMRGRNEPHKARLALRLAGVALAGGVGEHLCIEWYGFYAYSPNWSLFFGHVPVMVMVIWPFVIHSGFEIAKRLPGRVLLTGFAFVLADASLIEPIAVRAQLWHWTQPGLFGVPPIGVLGWAFFAVAAMWMWRVIDERTAGGSVWFELLVIPVAVVFAHAALIAAWWGALRWVNYPVPDWLGVGVVWVVATWAGWRALRSSVRLPRAVMMLRVPPAFLFGVLLVAFGRDQPALMAYAAAFVPGYVILSARAATS